MTKTFPAGNSPSFSFWAPATFHGGLDEIYLLEHTDQFTEFEKVYDPVKSYNAYQHISQNWNVC